MWLNTKTNKHVTNRDNSESGPWIVPATVQLLAKYAVNSSRYIKTFYYIYKDIQYILKIITKK